MKNETDIAPAAEDKKPKLSKNERFFAILFVAGGLILAASHTSTAVLKKLQVDEIRDEMQGLADAGKPEAILWVLKNVDSSEVNLAERLKTAAETGHPESMYRYALFLGFRRQLAERDTWMRKAAAVGYPQAVTIIHEMPVPVGLSQKP